MKKLIAIIASALTLGTFAADQRNVPFAVDTTDYEPGTEIDILVDGEYDGTIEATGGVIYYQANDYVIGQQVAFAPKMAGEPTPVAVWNAADFSSTQNGWSIDTTGCTFDDDFACTIGTQPIKIVNKTITGDTKTALYYTVVMDVANVPTTETTGALVTFGRANLPSYSGYVNSDLIGTMLENGTPFGIWNGAKRTNTPVSQTAIDAETTRLTVFYKSGNGDGVKLFAGDTGVFTADTGLRATMQANQINIGGRSSDNTMLLAGMKVKRIAIFADTTYAGDATMTAFDIPAGELDVISERLPTDDEKAKYQDESWTGTVWLKNVAWNNWDFGSIGNANSRVRLTGVTGYGPQTALKECATTVELADIGSTVALKQTDGFSTSGSSVCTYQFSKLIGTGTLQTAPARATPQIRIVDASEFNGSLNVAVMRVAIGEGTEPTVAAKVTIEEGATLTIAPGKSVNAVAGSGTLVLPNFTTSTGVYASLQNTAWTGTVEIKESTVTGQINLAQYGNANSTIKLDGMLGASRYLPNGCNITATLDVAGNVTFNQGSSSTSYTIAKVTGSGNLSLLNWSGSTNNDADHGYTITKLEGYTGTLTATRYTTISELALAEAPATGTKVVTLANGSSNTLQVLSVTIDGEEAPAGSSVEIQSDGIYYYATQAEAHIGDTDYATIAEAMTAAGQMEGNPVVELYKSVSEEVTIPANTTLVQGQQIKVTGAIHGTGTIQIAGPSATGTVNINTFLTSEQLADFAGTIHFASARIEVAVNFIPTAVTIKVTDGAQFYMGGPAGEFKWGNKFVISGNGWTGEPNNANLSHCAIRAEHPIADTATIECEVIDDVVPSIGCAQTDLNVGATITGDAVKFVVFWGPHNLAIDPAKIQVTDNVTLVGVVLNVATETAASLVSVIDGSIVKTGEGALTVGDSTTASIKLNGGTIVTANDGLTVTTDVENCHVEYNEGSYIIVADASELPGEALIDEEEKEDYRAWATDNGVTAETTTDPSVLAIAFHLGAEKGESFETIEEAAQAEVEALVADIDLSALAAEGETAALTTLNAELEEKGLVASLAPVTLEGASESTKLYQLVIKLKEEN